MLNFLRPGFARLFTPVELIIFVVTLIGGAIGLYGLVTGLITP